MTSDEMGRSLTRLKSILPQWAPKEIDRDSSLIWITVLKDFSDQEIATAFLKAATELTEWPAPATIKRLCQGSNKTDEENGQEVASRIEGAIIKFGFSNPTSAKNYIGELGWRVVMQCGGWGHICEVETDELPSARKYWRETAAMVSKNYFTKGENMPPTLPETKNTSLQSALAIAQGISS